MLWWIPRYMLHFLRPGNKVMNTRTLAFIYIIGVALAAPAAINSFTADVKITGDPNIQGLLTGKMYYSAGSPSAQRTDYTIGPIEIIDFDNKLRYLGCGSSCDAATWNEKQLQFLPQSTDVATGGTIHMSGRYCSATSRKTNSTKLETVTSLWADASGPCKAVTSTGRTFTFTNVKSLDDTSIFKSYQGWNCPQQLCYKAMDVVVAIDTSGSITADNWKQERDFVREFANAFDFGPTGVEMGLVLFSYTAVAVTPKLLSDKTSFTNTVNYTQRWQSGDTCIGCGIQTSIQLLRSSGRNVDKVLLILTDGGNNWDYQVDFMQQVQYAKSQSDLTVFAIGVSGDDLDTDSLKLIATNPQENYIEVGDFSQLLSKLQQVISKTCVNFPSKPCGSGCKGFCSCGETCICPECNDAEDQCNAGTCKASTGGAGCYYKAVTCQNGNKCQSGTCNPSAGCSYANSTCTNGDACNDAFCQADVGCITQSTADQCFKGDVCTNYTCDAKLGCQYSNITSCDSSLCAGVMCAQYSACEINTCDPTTGKCVARPKECGVTDPCVVSTCNPESGKCEFTEAKCDDGNACTTDVCVSGKGCSSTPIDVASVCDDYSVCTQDTCDPKLGCQNIYQPCPTKSVCLQDTCDPVLGCTYPPVDCYQNPNISTKVGGCHVVSCNDTSGCFLQLLDGAVEDRCGVCYGNGTTCLSPGAIAGISVGAIAGIALGAAAAVGIVAAVSGKVGYDYFASGAASAATVNDNPMYVPPGTERANPLYG
ncbi:hypothetical protein PROFUN_10995 [Planoprotostelium fungivorum]|uniref:VWFA domain-containing protein n=1 Tax=Planoprotostelium fungivorum TaxID=1890364 RepID=A0A2P6NBY8_9EUKA|nr:hypothetical protein PROFUN_10995 [Planoprotostelium fungivorum]